MQDRRTAALAWSNKPLTMPVLPPESKIREEGRMKYYNARSALPEPLFREVQRYVRGAYLYVPAPEHARWGEVSGARRELAERNEEIRSLRRLGMSEGELAERFCLSVYAIRNIISGK